MDTRTGHLYVLVDKRDRSHVRYVGISLDPTSRLRQHFSDAKRGKTYPVHNWIRKIGRENVRMEVETTEPIPYEVLLKLEQNTIWTYRMLDHELLNLTQGGEGVLGMRHTEEMKANMSKRVSGRGNPMYGTSNPEAAERNHLTKTGKPGHWEGKPRSEETKRKLSEANRGKAPAQKLTEGIVRAIKGDIENGMWGTEIAKKYGIAPTTVSNIRNGRRWGWVN